MYSVVRFWCFLTEFHKTKAVVFMRSKVYCYGNKSSGVSCLRLVAKIGRGDE